MTKDGDLLLIQLHNINTKKLLSLNVSDEKTKLEWEILLRETRN